MNKMATRAKNRNISKRLLLLYPWVDLIQTSLDCYLGDPLPK